MYSYEDRMRAVRLYLLGKRIRATIRQRGYPTKNSLKSWHREYERCHDLPAAYVRSKPRYSTEQKKAAVDHYLSHDRSAAATLRALGYPSRGTFAAWIEELCPELGKRIVGRAGSVLKSHEVMQAAVIELCTREENAREVAQKNRCEQATLYNWKNQLLGPKAPASMKRQSKPAPDQGRAELEKQVESLRRDIRQLLREHDILKKANELIKRCRRQPAVPEPRPKRLL